MIYFVILNYDNIKKKNKQKILILHYRNVHYIKRTSQKTKTKMTLVVFGTLKRSPPHR